MVRVRNDHVETTMIEESDDRLAAVEEAKRTGQPFVSVGANRTVVVPTELAAQIADDKAKENVYVGRFGATYAGHLESFHQKLNAPDGGEFVIQTNEEKARAHEEYSAELVRRQMEDEQRVREQKAQGFDPSLAIQQANLERAREHEGKSADYELLRQARASEIKPVGQVVDEMVEVVRANDLSTAPLHERVEAFAHIVERPDSLERTVNGALITKDKIVEVEVPFTDEAMQHDELVKRDRPGIEILDNAGSPEELSENTRLAQAAASNLNAGAVQKLDDVAKEVVTFSGEEITNEPGRVLREAEERVDPLNRPVADEMPENPSR